MKNSSQIFPFDLEIILGEEREKYVNFNIPVYKIFKGWERLDPYLEQDNYLVVFESKRKRYPFIDEVLNLVDYFAYREAKKMPGFRGYYRGDLDPITNKCRSFCIWETRESARRSGKQPNHTKAKATAKFFFDLYVVKRYIIKKRKDKTIFEEYFPYKEKN